MTVELMQAFNISATALGNLSAFYFYSYVAMQIPTGILADIWGPRRLLTTGAFIAGTGILMFALAPGIFWAYLGRFLIGGSVAVAFVGTLKLAAEWFPARFFSTVSGVALFFGIVGAVFAGTPLRLSVVAFGWRHTMLVSAGVTFAICAGIWLIVRDHPAEKGYAGFADAAARHSAADCRLYIWLHHHQFCICKRVRTGPPVRYGKRGDQHGNYVRTHPASTRCRMDAGSTLER
jgi:MFS family permease